MNLEIDGGLLFAFEGETGGVCKVGTEDPGHLLLGVGYDGGVFLGVLFL